jgi:hypothetical protein
MPQLALELLHGSTVQGDHGGQGRPRPSPRKIRGLMVAIVCLPVLLLHFGDSLMNGWMWRLTEAKAIYRETPRSKGVANRARNSPGWPAWADRSGPTGPCPFQHGSALFHSLTLLGQLLTFSLLYVGPSCRLLHGLDRAPCRASFNIFCSGPWSFVPSCMVLGSFGVMFTSSVDLCRAS